MVPPTPALNTNEIVVSLVLFMSDLAVRCQLSLPEYVRLMRGQSPADGRPNKNLYELPVPLTSAKRDVYHQWNDVFRVGVRPRWSESKPTLQTCRPDNHNSARVHTAEVYKHIRKGQLDGRYLVFDARVLDLWPELFLSPVGVIDKAGGEFRMINDYSFPQGASVNDFTERSNFPVISYNPPRDIARRIHELRDEFPNEVVLIMLGDVSGAFRHVPVHEDAVHMFAFAIDGYVVVDLSCGFGWCGSPTFYSLAGSTINDLYETSPVPESAVDSRHFHRSVWCDDHTCIEVNTEQRCSEANVALRHAMITVLGPSAINDKKFTSWSTENKALGLLWDTAEGTVSIPTDKISRAIARVDDVLRSSRATKADLNKLLGVFRHVATCFPSARAFYQRAHVVTTRMKPNARHVLEAPVIEDLKWFRAVLLHKDRFNKIPVSQFIDIATPAVHVYMDASNSGLCVLEPQRQEFLRLRFTTDEVMALQTDHYTNSINVRELQSAVLAVLVGGSRWQLDYQSKPTHVGLHIDNTSAVSWVSRRQSRHPTAQLYNHLLSLAELQYQLVLSAEHIPGRLNTMADAGLRAWTDTDPLWDLWTNLSSSWKQVEVTTPFDDLSAVWERYSVVTPWPRLQTANTEATGRSGGYFPK